MMHDAFVLSDANRMTGFRQPPKAIAAAAASVRREDASASSSSASDAQPGEHDSSEPFQEGGGRTEPTARPDSKGKKTEGRQRTHERPQRTYDRRRHW